jgi:hypothetical protein
MHKFRRLAHRTLLLTLILLGLILPHQLYPARGLNFTSPVRVPMGASLSFDPKLEFLDASPANGTALKSDPHVKYVDSDSNNIWDQGEAVVYDANNNSIYYPNDPVIAGTPSISAPLRVDAKIRFVDVNSNGLWDPGEAVVYDSKGNGIYITGEPIIAGSPPPLQALLTSDTRVKFVGSGSTWSPGNSVVYDSNNDSIYSASTDQHIRFVDSNNNGKWDPSKAVIYDTDLNGLYDLGEPVLAGQMPPTGTVLKIDPLIKFVDTDRNGVWESGEAIIYDSNNNGAYDLSKPVIVRQLPANNTLLTSDFRIKYVDSDNNTIWDRGEAVVLDTFGKGYYNASIDPKIMYIESDKNNVWDPNETVVYALYGPTTYFTGDPVIKQGVGSLVSGETMLSRDSHFRFVDSNMNGHWSQGKPVIYDSNLDNIYETTIDIVVAGPAPVNGTLLSEPVINGTTPKIGTRLSIDSKLKLVDTNRDNLWDPGEAVVYDTNNNGLYNTGKPVIVGAIPPVGSMLSEPVMAGPIPAIGTLLKSDSRIRFLDSDLNKVWDPGEMLVYDSDFNNRYDLGEQVIAYGAQGDGLWDPGETVVYDSNFNGLYNTGEPVVVGTTPVNNTFLRSDPLIRYVDANGNGRWDPGKTVIYDSDRNGLYDPGEPIIAGLAPPLKITLWPSVARDQIGRVWLAWSEKTIAGSDRYAVYFKLWNGSAWIGKQQVNTDTSTSVNDNVVKLSNQTMMILWASNSTGHNQLFYRLYSSGANPSPTTNQVQLTNSLMTDTTPSAIQDRNGRIWVAWTRQNATSSINSVYYKYYNGSSWSADFSIPGASNPHLNQRSPSLYQSKDGRIWAAWASNDTGVLNLYYSTTNGTITALPLTGIPATSWTSKTPLFSNSLVDDDHPSLMQARDGTLWLFWQQSTNTGVNVFAGSSSDNGVTWTTNWSTTGTDVSPASGQMADGRIWVFWNRQGSQTEEIWYQTSDQITGIHDVGISGVTAAPQLIRSGDNLTITVTVTNYGDFQEKTNATINLNNTVLIKVPVTIMNGASLNISLTWTSPTPNWGRYVLTAAVQPVPGENSINKGDDFWTGRLVRISPWGDVDRNGDVTIIDLAIVALYYGATPASPNWNVAQVADLDHDGHVDIGDLAIVATYYGKSV